MSGSTLTSFRYGPLMGWHLDLRYSWLDGDLARATVTLEGPYHAELAYAGLFVAPGVDGYGLARDAIISGGHDRLMRVAQWILEQVRTALDTRDDLPQAVREYWARLTAMADTATADYYARPENARQRHPFEVLAEITVDVERELAAV